MKFDANTCLYSTDGFLVMGIQGEGVLHQKASEVERVCSTKCMQGK